MTQIFSPTLRQTPAEAEIASHRLMLRAGLIRKTASGMYTYLPLAYRAIKKIEQIVREEMDAAGGQELLLPIVQPAELWHETGRWEDYGEEMFKLTDRNDRQFCLGPTHEEIITDLVRREVRSYRQLPLLLYQIQNKYRDEIRPRFGVIRGREFIMKDLYSFDKDEKGLEESYRKMRSAYERVFKRCGVEAKPVEADPGAIGGNATHEFMVMAPSGEAAVVSCDSCSYAANVERARCLPASAGSAAETAETSETTEELLPVVKVDTPGVSTIDELSAFLGKSPERMIKTIIYVYEGETIGVLVRGDHSVNEVKLLRALGGGRLRLAEPEEIVRATGAPVGFAGPVGLSIRLIADSSAVDVKNAITGANQADAHLMNVNRGRDYEVSQVADIRSAMAGDTCPECKSGKLYESRGIEVGQVFKLGTKYSEPLGATYLDESGVSRPIVMGCYGIGISRTLAAIIEQNHDEDGIKWPVSVAPYHVIIVPVSENDPRQMEAAEKLYGQMLDLGVEVVLDDRSERAGVKFKDADLIGFPFRVTVGPRSLASGMVEIRTRSTGRDQAVPLEEAAQFVKAAITSALDALNA